MAKTYKWKQEEAPADLKERTIIASEQTTETKEEIFTVAQKLNEFKNAKQAVLDAQKKVEGLKAELLTIKEALSIEVEVK